MSGDDIGQFFESAKRISDRRAARGLPLDGNFEPRNRGDEIGDGGSSGGSFLGAIVVGLCWALVYAVGFGLWLIWQIVKVIALAIFSRRR